MFLGIVPSNNGRHHDPSACLVDDGEILAYVEEERITRDKHAHGEFPVNAVTECLEIAGADLTDVAAIGLSRNYDNRKKATGRLARRALRSTHTPLVERLHDATILPLKQRVTMTNGTLRSLTRTKLARHLGTDADSVPPVQCLNHHRTHAASAFYPSGFDEALVVSLDNYGGHLSTVVYKGSGDELVSIKSFPRFNSFGRFYSDITDFLGFRRSNGEGKVMGLAPYGREDANIGRVIADYIEYGDGEYNTEALTYRETGDAVRKLERDLAVEQRYWREEIRQVHKDIAYHAQATVEAAVSDLVAHYLDRTGAENVCLAGGVALNCKMNKRIRELPGVSDMFVQPAANDAGGSIGAALALSVANGSTAAEMRHPYHGTRYTTAEIREELDSLKVSYEVLDDVEAKAASLIADGRLVGWFQGAMEGGPRALGNRSILADPRSVDSRDRVNRHVKHREEWRPFAPSMLRAEADRFLDGAISKAAYFMIDTYETTERAREEIPAVLHPEDETTRPQIVDADRNERYHGLLRELKAETGVGAVLNTSFNDSGEPIVRTPREAVRDFYSMGLDDLVIGDVLVQKDG